jgi:hypothetical protein
MEEANPQDVSKTARKRILWACAEGLCILIILALSGAILIPVLKGPSSEAARRPEFDRMQAPLRNSQR